MKIAVTGASGKIGKALLRRGCFPIGCDILQPNDLIGEINSINPDVVIHCAALTDVDYCETHFEKSFEVNVRGTINVFDALPKNSTMIYISTDHIFSGEQWFNTGYGEWHKPEPVNIYGFTKWGGELALNAIEGCRTIIVRTSKGYDYEFMKPTIDALNSGKELEFTDLIKRSFMYTPHFVDALLWLIQHLDELNDVKVVNITGDSIWSYYTFWSMMQNCLGLGGIVIPRRIRLNPATVSPRPFRGGLNVRYAKKLGIPLGSLQDAISDLKERIKNDSGSNGS